jgi:hypothetical protein
LLIKQVVMDGALVAACGEQVLVYRVPGQRSDLVRVASAQEHVAHHAQVEYADDLISARRSEKMALVWFEERLRDLVLA